MATEFSFGHLKFDLGTETRATRAEPNDPFRVCLLGDFSARAHRTNVTADLAGNLAGRRPVAIDIDNAEDVFRRCEVRLELRFDEDHDSAPPVTLQPGTLDDLHPDRIYATVDVFRELRDLRAKLDDPATFAAAATRIAGLTNDSTAPADAAPTTPTPPATGAGESDGESDGDSAFARLLGGSHEPTGESAIRSKADRALDAMLERLVTPHIVPGDDPRKDGLIEAVDAATSTQMRAILHHEVLQECESTWRGAEFLFRQLDTDEELGIYLFDVTKSELRADLAREDLSESELYKVLVEQSVGTAGGVPWTTLTALFKFEATAEDIDLLGRLTKVAAAAGAPLLAEASPRFVGSESPFAATPDPRGWTRDLDSEAAASLQALRALPESTFLGLAAPRVLGRLPYGAKTEPTETFAFEEYVDGEFTHDNYLWASPAIACTYMLAEGFSEQGWEFRNQVAPRSGGEVGDIPVHVTESDGEQRMQPCAEIWLTERAAAAIVDAGLIPIASIQGRDAIRVITLQSVNQSESELAGRWVD